MADTTTPERHQPPPLPELEFPYPLCSVCDSETELEDRMFDCRDCGLSWNAEAPYGPAQILYDEAGRCPSSVEYAYFTPGHDEPSGADLLRCSKAASHATSDEDRVALHAADSNHEWTDNGRDDTYRTLRVVIRSIPTLWTDEELAAQAQSAT